MEQTLRVLCLFVLCFVYSAGLFAQQKPNRRRSVQTIMGQVPVDSLSKKTPPPPRKSAENLASEPSAPVKTETPPVKTEVAAAPVETAEPEPVAAAPPTPSDITKSFDWDGFIGCMNKECGSGNRVSPNSGCYERNLFAIAFNNCKGEISGENKEPYRDYFWEKILPPEMQTACKVRKGDFNTGHRTCTVEVVYTNYYAPAISNAITAKAGCKHNKSVKVPLNGKIFDCTPERFGVQRCYQEDPDAEKKNAKNTDAINNMVAAGLGDLAALASKAANDAKKEDFSADETVLVNLKKQLAAADEKTSMAIKTQLLGEINDMETTLNKKKMAQEQKATIQAGKAPSSPQRMETISLGKQVLGKCELATGERVNEGDTIKMVW